MSRRITYQGKRFTIPDGYKYVVADNDGKVCAYIDPPTWNPNRGEWHDNGAGTMKPVGWIAMARFPVRELK